MVELNAQVDAESPSPWEQRFRAARVSLPSWAEHAPTRAVYATNASGVWQLTSWDLERGVHTPLTNKATGIRRGNVLPDGSGVVWFDDDAGSEIGRYVVTPFAGGELRALAPDLPVGWSAGIALRQERIVVGVANDQGFRIATVASGRARVLYRHDKPAHVGGLSADAELIGLAHCEHGDVLHPTVKLLKPDGTEVAALWDGPGNTIRPAAWSPLRGDQRLAISADRSGRTRPEILDAITGERRVLAIDLPGEVTVADWWPDGRALLLRHNHLGRSSLLRYDLDSDGLTPIDVGDGTVAGARIRDDGALWYAFQSSRKAPSVRYRDDGGDRVLLAPPGPAAPDGVAFRSLHYPNDDGDQVHAFLAVPEGDGPFPLVVEAHGGPHWQVHDKFEPFIQAWVDHGFAVLAPNYRGSTGYGKQWQDALDGDPGRPELVDLQAGRDHLVAMGLADPERVVLTGGSWGGYLTLQGIGTQPESWSAAVAIVPVADYLTAYEDESPELREFDRSLFGGSPEEVSDLFRERSPLTHVANVRVPVLIITGANDTRCPRRQVDNYVAALQRHGLPHRYDVFEAGHGSLAMEENIRQQALALDFVATHLGTPPAER